MLNKIAVLLVLVPSIIVVMASDPDPINDLCIANSADNSFSCKNSSTTTVEDFTFSGIKFPGNFKNWFFSKGVNSNDFPGLNTLGVSFVRADFDVGGVNVPHFHPRATEVVFVLKGKIYSGFVDTKNKVFAKVLEEGEVMVFPRGLVHFQMNVGDGHATILGSFDSQNPGLVRIPNAVFGSEINEQLLEKAFGLSSKELSRLKKRWCVLFCFECQHNF
ncbi:putative germin, rmlC-like cupin domain-containing protein [Lupinus albus]|uniref:Germin-like protein n=1 Tax=Lupinus albus TaxID=3870 RepID=A0A6A4R080_LUPAL|nr:putative germin, rmlC-like cupin domain-containing protein [Lupinus albus]